MWKIFLVPVAAACLFSACSKQIAVQPTSLQAPEETNNSRTQDLYSYLEANGSNINTTNWLTYNDKFAGYSIMYPPDLKFKVVTNTTKRIEITNAKKDASGAATQRYMNISLFVYRLVENQDIPDLIESRSLSIAGKPLAPYNNDQLLGYVSENNKGGESLSIWLYCNGNVLELRLLGSGNDSYRLNPEAVGIFSKIADSVRVLH